MMTVLRASGLTVERSDGAPIVEDVSLSLDKGEVMGIVGESGSGKSTLALALLAYARRGVRIAGGSVRVAGTDMLELDAADLRKARREVVAYVAQDPGAALNPMLTLGTLLTEGLAGGRAEKVTRAREILRKVGLPDDEAFLQRRPRQLSGGQQQRIAIAMAVIAKPKLIILDEPTTGLDVSTRAKVLDLIRQLCISDDLTAIYVSHDLAVIANVADHVTVMYGGQVVEQGRMQEVLATPRHPYTRALLDAVPSLQVRQDLRPIRGRVPAVGEAPDGCIFSDRCDYAVDACSTQPALRLVGGTQVRCVRPELAQTFEMRPQAVSRSERQGASRPAVLQADGINAFYGHRQILFDVGLKVEPGRCLAVVGESGSGKSTLSRCLIGLHGNVTGEFRLDGKPLPLTVGERDQHARQRLQYIFQNPNASLNPRRTIGQSLAAALVNRPEASGYGTIIAEALERVGISPDLATRYPAELSGGQRQRVAIARALVANPGVLLCDEVTSSLDVSVQASVIELLRSLLADGLGMLFVTHDLAVVRNIADTVAVLSAGRVVEQGGADKVLSAPSHPYTQSLLANTLQLPTEAVPAIAPRQYVGGSW
ncbi:MAG TPA: ABC transporter ATP-binding protein [Mesorhizobium sp.]|jgi:peptide/nickel transport system ATP-binding protein|uniref:ABC transporter ATP-binding protein n=1 Tax=Mesorhizobium sp. TaxID=1871066 RepID=UPI002DDCFFCF|nr:ABC transporter ATP-binding protein [Mesorhizobium sp.]HEV2507772.1 ABC transporter ATP-binding protein [Mesorhizobium sp.]